MVDRVEADGQIDRLARNEDEPVLGPALLELRVSGQPQREYFKVGAPNSSDGDRLGVWLGARRRIPEDDLGRFDLQGRSAVAVAGTLAPTPGDRKSDAEENNPRVLAHDGGSIALRGSPVDSAIVRSGLRSSADAALNEGETGLEYPPGLRVCATRAQQSRAAPVPAPCPL
jgi:hypothetical protein